jgi:hypothetical protein
MGFNKVHKVAFVHIPKNAGQSVRKTLGNWEYGANHLTAKELKQINPKLWKEYKTIAIVRNPWDRMVSLYHYSKLHNSYRFEQKAFKLCFEEWLIDIYCKHLHDDEIVHGKHWMQYVAHNQLQWIQEKGNIIVDKIIRFENLTEEWKKLFDVPLRLDNRTNHKTYQTYYNDHLEGLVYKAFKEDIEYFNYRFENGKEASEGKGY